MLGLLDESCQLIDVNLYDTEYIISISYDSIIKLSTQSGHSGRHGN